jgi:IMP dehydrogenase
VKASAARALAEPAFFEVLPEGVKLSRDVETVLTNKSAKKKAVTFDEVTLADQPVEFHPNDVNLKTWVTRRIVLKGSGLISAAMDTVTEKEMALAMAKIGGMGILHRNLSPQEQASQLNWVRKKIHFGGMIDRPICFSPTDRYSTFQAKVAAAGWTFTSFPVVDTSKKMLGLITRDQLEFVDGSSNPLLSEIMLDISQIVTATQGTNSEAAFGIMSKHKVKKLPVLNTEGMLLGLYVWNDVRNDQRLHEKFSLDDDGHFLVGAAIGVGAPDLARADLLIENGCKVLVIDSSHGSCKPVKDTLAAIRQKHGDKVQIIVGNIASYPSAKYLLEGDAKPDALKVGIGPGSICTTRLVTGHGVPQVTAIFEVWRAVRDSGYPVPIIADGGIRSSGDIVKCFAAGASGVMLGSALAGCSEAPGAVIIKNGRKYKTIRGMGSRSAMEERSGSRGRYHQQSDTTHVSEGLTKAQAEKMVPEGVEGLVQFSGTCEKMLTQLQGGVQAGLAHSGAKSIPAFQAVATFWMQGQAGTAEGKPHDLTDVRD